MATAYSHASSGSHTGKSVAHTFTGALHTMLSALLATIYTVAQLIVSSVLALLTPFAPFLPIFVLVPFLMLVGLAIATIGHLLTGLSGG